MALLASPRLYEKEVLQLSLKSDRFDRFIHLLKNNIEAISCSYSVYRQFQIFVYLTIWSLYSRNHPKLHKNYSR